MHLSKQASIGFISVQHAVARRGTPGTTADIWNKMRRPDELPQNHLARGCCNYFRQNLETARDWRVNRKGSLNCIGIAYAQGNSSFVLCMDNRFAFPCIRSQHYTKVLLIFTKACRPHPHQKNCNWVVN